MSVLLRRWWVGLLFVLALFVLLAWFFLSWRQGPFTLLVNTGNVCLRPGARPSVVEASFSPGCFSSTCTRSLHQSGSARADVAGQTLRFYGRFLLRNLDFPRGSQACTRDCGGGGSLQLQLTGLAEGIYDVVIGGRWVGEVSLPLRDGEVCFDDQPPYPVVTDSSPGPIATQMPDGGLETVTAPAPTRPPANYPPPTNGPGAYPPATATVTAGPPTAYP